VGEIYEGQKVFEVLVWATEPTRHSLSSLRELLIETGDDDHVRLGDIARVEVVAAPNVIKRESVSRRIDVGCNVSGRELGAVARDIEAKIAGLSFPNGYHPELLGEYAERQAASERMQLFVGIALIGIFFLLQASFGSFRLALLAFSTLPMALVGGVIAAAAAGGVISLGSIVGFITVLGIAARNGIMLLTHYQHLEREEGETFGRALVLRGARERLTPILMTALTTGLALLPLALTGNLPGHEIEHPMAVVILGGLLTSTLLNLLVLPALYLRFGRAGEATPDTH
jgi:Cu/Ag efflux pump CusA